MADDPFDAHRGQLENFEDDLIDLCYDLIDASYDTYNAYYSTFPNVLEGIYAAPEDYVQNIIAPTPYDFDNDQFGHEQFRNDISNLAQAELPTFLDGADPSQFSEIVTRLGRASEHLDEATGYSGLEQLVTLLSLWQGTAAYNFQHEILPKYGITVVHQLVFIEELMAVAMCLQQVIERTRGDAIGLAEDLLGKVEIPDTSISLGTVLWVAGAIASGIATFGTSTALTAAVVAGRIAYGIGTATAALGHVQALSGGGTEDRAIQGDTAYEYIPSCREQIERIIEEGTAEVEVVMGALDADLGSDGVDMMSITKPAILDGAEFELIDEERKSDEFLVESIADLRFAGVVTLPTMAEYFDKAYGEVVNLGYPFDGGIGYSVVASTSRASLDAAIETLANSFKDSRDYLYRAGVALRDIADEYFESEELNRAMLDNFNQQFDEVDLDAFPRYAPSGPSPNADRITTYR